VESGTVVVPCTGEAIYDSIGACEFSSDVSY
jgi:hypothetical protein